MPKLDRLTAEIRACRLCIESPQGRALPHEPRPVFRVSQTARICIAGQAPGTRVHASGTPFTDPSGDRLRVWMGVTPDEFYDVSRIAIVPMGFCFPGLDAKGGDLPPRRECAPRWRAPLFEMMPQIELVLAIGQYAQAWHLGPSRRKSLTETVAAWEAFYPRCIPLPHPSWRNNAWLGKNPWFEEELLPVLKRDVRRLLGAE
ncbi:uracil-DNA glycosylase family protein [Parvibaculum sp.]|uniref:uracil-DNA glycosylase family protein n=1 Tax=Parvibaculum sp. TaxID=2024848 RepID=UPI003919DA7B